MRSFGRVRCQVPVPLGGNSIREVDRPVLAAWLRKVSGKTAHRRPGGAAECLERMAAAVEAAPASVHEVKVAVDLGAEDADSIRMGITSLIDHAMATPPQGTGHAEIFERRAASYALHMLRREWMMHTGWRGDRQAADSDGNPVPGSGYRR